ncbi:protein transporter sec24 [Plasmopara halstedii]|uniref:Protein transporter sec24 n=1 Tax=Plasmopara halstedii TaxID=4781 RepID=A0A0P1A541_PLAHL|nr:protein transporter sec24 [Plasmopara halstedii]CEG35429.1 protein transporter sec24 [Plasmopara halstedii]|eukprot:XP_024571798.1 protein transporter sec24 [Plasmopara halstedii]
MNNPPYQPYGGPTQRNVQQQAQTRQAAPLHPFHSAQANAPLSGSGGLAFTRSVNSGPPSAGSLNPPPPPNHMGGGSHGFVPSRNIVSGPSAPLSQQSGRHPTPMSGGPSYGSPIGYPATGQQPPMMHGPPAGLTPPISQGMRGPTGSAAIPPNGLTEQFSNMGINNGPPGMSTNGFSRGPPSIGASLPPMGGSMAPPAND